MTVLSSMAIFFIIWWVTLFAVLPFGVRTQQEDGHVVPGSEPSAPARPRIWRAAAITTAIALVVFALVQFILVQQWVSLEDLVTPPRNW